MEAGYFREEAREGLAATALSAIDVALWDLKAKLLGQPLVSLLGQMRESAPVYGSGGFTSYSDSQLQTQFSNWVAEGIPRVAPLTLHPERGTLLKFGAVTRVSRIWVAGTTGLSREDREKMRDGSAGRFDAVLLYSPHAAQSM